jgi:hypothetical protein
VLFLLINFARLPRGSVLFFERKCIKRKNMGVRARRAHQRNLARANDDADDFSALLRARCGQKMYLYAKFIVCALAVKAMSSGSGEG